MYSQFVEVVCVVDNVPWCYGHNRPDATCDALNPDSGCIYGQRLLSGGKIVGMLEEDWLALADEVD